MRRRPATPPATRPLHDRLLSRICPDKGLHLLVGRLETAGRGCGLAAAAAPRGRIPGPADRPYLAELSAELAAAGLADRFQYLGELDRADKIAFLQSLDVMSVPSICRESKGLSVFEAWANGVPAVLPAHGAFPEMVADTGGGLLCAPGDAAALAAGLKQMIAIPIRRRAAAAAARRPCSAAITPGEWPKTPWLCTTSCWTIRRHVLSSRPDVAIAERSGGPAGRAARAARRLPGGRPGRGRRFCRPPRPK